MATVSITQSVPGHFSLLAAAEYCRIECRIYGVGSSAVCAGLLTDGALIIICGLVRDTITIVTMIASLALLSLAMRTLPLGTAYTVWTGIGAIGAFAVGVIVLGEAASPMRLLAAALILVGIILMKLSSATG